MWECSPGTREVSGDEDETFSLDHGHCSIMVVEGKVDGTAEQLNTVSTKAEVCDTECEKTRVELRTFKEARKHWVLVMVSSSGY